MSENPIDREAVIDDVACALAAKESYVAKVTEAYEALSAYQEAYAVVLEHQQALNADPDISEDEQFDMFRQAVERAGFDPEKGEKAIKDTRDDAQYRELLSKAPLN